jgi:hypothetical protein
MVGGTRRWPGAPSGLGPQLALPRLASRHRTDGCQSQSGCRVGLHGEDDDDDVILSPPNSGSSDPRQISPIQVQAGRQAASQPASSASEALGPLPAPGRPKLVGRSVAPSRSTRQPALCADAGCGDGSQEPGGGSRDVLGNVGDWAAPKGAAGLGQQQRGLAGWVVRTIDAAGGGARGRHLVVVVS